MERHLLWWVAMTTCLACKENTFDPDPEECVNTDCSRNQYGLSFPGFIAVVVMVVSMFALVTWL